MFQIGKRDWETLRCGFRCGLKVRRALLLRNFRHIPIVFMLNNPALRSLLILSKVTPSSRITLFLVALSSTFFTSTTAMDLMLEIFERKWKREFLLTWRIGGAEEDVSWSNFRRVSLDWMKENDGKWCVASMTFREKIKLLRRFHHDSEKGEIKQRCEAHNALFISNFLIGIDPIFNQSNPHLLRSSYPTFRTQMKGSRTGGFQDARK